MQIYFYIGPVKDSTSTPQLQKCLKSGQAWMAANKLKLKLSVRFPIDVLGIKLTTI